MKVSLNEVFLRDGLQDVDTIVSTPVKIDLARQLIDVGFRRIEAGSFVNPTKVPQMADSAEVFAGLNGAHEVEFSALALNARGVDRAIEAGAGAIQIVASASDEHSRANAGRSTTSALKDLAGIVESRPGASFLAGVSTAFTCPYSGSIPRSALHSVVESFRDMGIDRIGLADTLGNAPTDLVIDTMAELCGEHTDVSFSLHLHDGLGQALDTAVRATDLGIARFDSALGGFGGCPFAPGAHGNVATAELARTLTSYGHDTGLDLDGLDTLTAVANRAVASGSPVPA